MIIKKLFPIFSHLQGKVRNIMSAINSQEICLKYINSLNNPQTINDTKNALIRYFVPSVGGPSTSAAKRRPVPVKEAEAALEFLHQVSLEKLADSPEWALKILESRDSSTAQKERVRRDLRNLVDWAREKGYLPPPHNPVPKGICEDIQLGRFKELNLQPATALDIYNQYLRQLPDREAQTDLSNGIIRYFVPGTGGPLPFHKPALEDEVKAALKYLEHTPLEYLNEATSIATAALDALELGQDHHTRIRSALRDMIRWAREQQYLPHPHSIAPWGGEYVPGDIPSYTTEPAVIEQQKVFDIYSSYCQYLQTSGKNSEIKPLQSIIIRYFLPACGGVSPHGHRASGAEIQDGINYLKQISLEQLFNAVKLVESQFEFFGIEIQKRYAPRSRLKAWIDWADEQGYFNTVGTIQKPEPVFNTFRKNSFPIQKKKPGMKLHQNRCPVHALCAREFPNDYINSDLQQQIEDYKAWRLSNNVRPGGLATEAEQILQLLGWLHRYEGIPLNKLSFECVITKSQLLFSISDYPDYSDYLYQKEKGIQLARQQADLDIKRVQRYLNFVGKHPESQKRRLSLIIAISKFIYRDLIGSDDFPLERDISIIRRLLVIHVNLNKDSKSVSQTVSYHETSVQWSTAIMVMENQRRRAEQAIIYLKNKRYREGYYEKPRTNTSLANELQKFLSIAFCLLVPSRSRTFYDLCIGETFKEGILTEKKFFSVEEMKNSGILENDKGSSKFYIHHQAENYKTGKSMAPALKNNGGWWVEIPNIEFGDKCLYDYIHRWLKWGRGVQGIVDHNFFFRHTLSTKPLDCGNWGARIKILFEHWTGVPVPPGNIRKMFASQFPEDKEAASLLLQHSEQIHNSDYDMRHSIKKIQPVMEVNQQFIADILSQIGSNADRHGDP